MYCIWLTSISHLLGLAQPSEFADLQVDDVTRVVLVRRQDRLNAVHVLVEDEWQVGVLSHLQQRHICDVIIRMHSMGNAPRGIL